MPHITSIANNKGGVAKTEVTCQLAAALARKGQRVLVVDMDPQANATRRLGIEWDPASPIPTMSEVIAAGREGAGEAAVLACGWDTNVAPEGELIDVLPSRFDLINRESEAGVVGAVRRLTKALDGWTHRYDVVLIDTRPDLGHLVQMAFAASHSVLIPCDPNYDSIEAAIRVRDFVTRHSADLANPNLSIAGVVVTRRRLTAEHDFQLEGLVGEFGDLVWKLGGVVKLPDGTDLLNPNYIPEWSRFAEADAAATSLSAWSDRNSRKTLALYDALASRFTAALLTSEAAA
ncbi:AAA family ATPase [Curtobacterium sp. RHCKG23]|jgi:chromosome partitioning protein|uniref:AAA family ATPase n=1 Tax=Curtobacterium citri TaxID=3055139 RepID=A0ABT7TAI6_9MICO|nr:AAA family ATPase [Curtobacterium citri]MDM7886597.1 AAA family ATPase [Curtobacterium citri]